MVFLVVNLDNSFPAECEMGYTLETQFYMTTERHILIKIGVKISHGVKTTVCHVWKMSSNGEDGEEGSGFESCSHKDSA